MRDLTAEQVIDAHADLFGISRSAARDRVHDAEGLDAAVVRPANYRHYRGADIALQAAALAHAIAERQVFIDGNKRTALFSLRYFLGLNGYTTSASEDERVDWMIRISHGWGPDEPRGPDTAAQAPPAARTRHVRARASRTRVVNQRPPLAGNATLSRLGQGHVARNGR